MKRKFSCSASGHSATTTHSRLGDSSIISIVYVHSGLFSFTVTLGNLFGLIVTVFRGGCGDTPAARRGPRAPLRRFPLSLRLFFVILRSLNRDSITGHLLRRRIGRGLVVVRTSGLSGSFNRPARGRALGPNCFRDCDGLG